MHQISALKAILLWKRKALLIWKLCISFSRKWSKVYQIERCGSDMTKDTLYLFSLWAFDNIQIKVHHRNVIEKVTYQNEIYIFLKIISKHIINLDLLSVAQFRFSVRSCFKMFDFPWDVTYLRKGKRGGGGGVCKQDMLF